MYYVSKNSTKATLKELDAEMAGKLKELAKTLESGGDIIEENPLFMEERSRIMYEYDRKREKIFLSRNCIIIEDMPEYKEFDGTKVIIGSTVEIDYDGDIETYTILGNDEGKVEENILSCDAPISIALIGRKVGEIIQFRGLTIKILKVSL